MENEKTHRPQQNDKIDSLLGYLEGIDPYLVENTNVIQSASFNNQPDPDPFFNQPDPDPFTNQPDPDPFTNQPDPDPFTDQPPPLGG